MEYSRKEESAIDIEDNDTVCMMTVAQWDQNKSEILEFEAVLDSLVMDHNRQPYTPLVEDITPPASPYTPVVEDITPPASPEVNSEHYLLSSNLLSSPVKCSHNTEDAIFHCSNQIGFGIQDEQEEEYHLEQEIDNFPAHMFTLQLHHTASFKQYNSTLAEERSYSANLRPSIQNNNLMLGHILGELTHLFEVLLLEISYNYKEHDLVRIYISHSEETGCNIIVGPKYVGDMTTQLIVDAIARVVRSNNFIPADQKLTINVAAVKNLSGQGRVTINNIWKDLKRKTCILQMANHDHLCLPRCIAVGLARLQHKADPANVKKLTLYNSIRNKDRKRKYNFHSTSLQKLTALKYMTKAGIPHQRVGLMSDIPLYEEALQVGISVISARGNNKKVYSANTSYTSRIYIYHIDEGHIGNGHFAVITKMNALLGNSYYCDNCDVGFNNDTNHRCFAWCNLCGSNYCLQETTVQCTDCHAPCRSAACLQRHSQVNGQHPSKCEQMFFCPHCLVRLKTKNTSRPLNKHVCGESFCRNCQVYTVNSDHQCYMRATPTPPHVELNAEQWPKRFLFYDFESMQDEGGGEHTPNLVVAHSICTWCQSETILTPTSTCNSCGSRCHQCSDLNKTRTFFKNPPCPNTCGVREVIFQGEQTVKEFCEWLIHPQHKNVTAFAHNARAYDTYFIYNYMINNSIRPQILFQGSKIMVCKIYNGIGLTLLDSLNFLPMALSQLPKSFGLDTLKKGYFPHMYNSRDILQDEDNLFLEHLPPISYYDPNTMSRVQRDQFMTWYNEHKDQPFNFHEELLEYCRSDVNILLSACWKFRQLVITATGVDPYNYVTIASVCMGIFRTRFLPETWSVLLQDNTVATCNHEWQCHCSWTPARKLTADSELEININEVWSPLSEHKSVMCKFLRSPVALPPTHGYSRRDNYSMQALQWLHVFQTQHEDAISLQTCQHALGEKKVHYTKSGKQFYYKLDGYFRDGKGKHHAVEFYGCWWHGCPRCYPRDRDKLKIKNKSINHRYLETMIKELTLKQLGYQLHTKWSCEFERDIQDSPAVQHIIKTLNIEEPINLRDCFFGGRTNALKLYKSFKAPSKGAYCDFCSLYPAVLKYNTFPVGHPLRITSDFLPMESVPCNQPGQCLYTLCKGNHLKLPYFGAWKVKVLPPRNLYHPVLPVRCNDKLMFPLCHKCAKNQQQEHLCQCSAEERSITQTYCSPELEVAINMGYKITTIYEVLHWPETETLDPITGKGGLFSQYINTFLQFKTEASGFPANSVTEEDKLKYIADYASHEGVHLQYDKIEKNPGLRSLAKLALNSFYGKFGQRSNMKKCLFVTDYTDYCKIMTDYSKKICDFHVMANNLMLVEYCNSVEFEPVDVKTNVIVAAFCTTWARLKLWAAMEKINHRVIYHDTDSIIYSFLPNDYCLPTGQYLGELTDELSCDKLNCVGCKTGHYIVEFVSCGPKNYAYRLNSGEIVCKVRGFCLNFNASQIINFESMKDVLLAWKNKVTQPEMITVKGMILRNKYDCVIYTKHVPKNYGLVYTKRRVLDNLDTVPYGYCK